MVLEQSSLDEITRLHREAEGAARLNECRDAAALLDQAIAVGIGAGLDMLVIKAIREVFRSEQCGSVQAAILILHRQSELIALGNNNHVERLEALIKLIPLLIDIGDKRAALECLSQAELLIAILRATEAGQIEQHFPASYPLSAAHFLQLRSVALMRLREQVRLASNS
jgi:hypothetical protein